MFTPEVPRAIHLGGVHPLKPRERTNWQMLVAKNLHKIYNNGPRPLHVLKGIDLEVKKAKVLAIVGPSGAGKSTLLHLLGGLDSPNEGKVYLEGMDLYGLGEDQRARIRNQRIGFVFQFYHLLPELTALENVMLPALMNNSVAGNRRSAREKAKGKLKIVGLENRFAHRPSQLSGGEQQRTAIARALMNDPDILFCDEPTGNLDSETGKQIIELLDGLNKDKKCTLCIVTHQEEIVNGADQVLHILDGRII